MTRRQKIEELLAKLGAPKVREAVEHVLSEQRVGIFLRDSVRAWLQSRVLTIDMAFLIALEAIELLEGGALEVDCSGPRGFKMRLYPWGYAADCGLEVLADAKTGVRYVKLHFHPSSKEAVDHYELGETVHKIARELRGHTGLQVTVHRS